MHPLDPGLAVAALHLEILDRADKVRQPLEAIVARIEAGAVPRELADFAEAGKALIVAFHGIIGVDQQIGRATSELQSLMRISYAVFCLKKKISTTSRLK